MNYKIWLWYRIPEEDDEQREFVLNRLNNRFAYNPETSIFLKIFNDSVIKILLDEWLIIQVPLIYKISKRRIQFSWGYTMIS